MEGSAGEKSDVATLDQQLRSRGSVSADTSQDHVVDVQATADENGDGSTTGNFICRPAIHFVLAFHDLTYSVKRPRRSFSRSRGDVGATDVARRNTLLDGISGEAREGEIMAVLGASGAGKSTLIDALASRIQRESLRGAVTLNGDALDSRLLRVISAYVMQDDLLYPMLTVAETLMYSAEFRLPRSLSTSKKRSRVQALIDQLGLRAAANTIIGDEGHRGVSGGERRRVSIGIDIIHDPIILFLDEPTSGLDSTSAFMVVKVLQRIAQSGSVVIMSIHQPSYRILGLLDRLLFLSKGRTVYYAPPASLPLFFSELGKPIPDGENPAEFALDHIRELEGTHAGTEELVQFSKSWQDKPLSRAVSAASAGPLNRPSLSFKEAICLSVARGKLVSGMSTTSAADAEVAATTKVSTYANPWWVELWVLTRRGFTNTMRTPELFQIRLGAVVVTAIILATIFWRLDNTPKGVNERFSFFAIAMSTMFYTSADALPVFLIERYIFLRETAHNAYRRSSYTLSNAIVAFPPLVFLSYPYEAVMQNEFGADPGKCFMRGVQMFDGTPMGKLPVATQVTVLNAMSKSMRIDFNSTSCITTGTDILAKQAVDQLGKWGCLWATVAWGFLFRILFYLTLLLGSSNKGR
ncbi:ABC transporter G family member 5-like [Lolium rigidum]|uniref:ABC transporter G family member 5-like n=1 Tax=Lolium rigidum TaxID=89674 RepID=UPI001F5D32DB|nr:ABC transporter G family member 5-like [Lolium rigidum]